MNLDQSKEDKSILHEVTHKTCWCKPKIIGLATGGRITSWKTVVWNNETLSNSDFEVQEYCSILSREKYRVMTNWYQKKTSNLRIAVANEIEVVLSCWKFLMQNLPQLIPQDLSVEQKHKWIVNYLNEQFEKQEKAKTNNFLSKLALIDSQRSKNSKLSKKSKKKGSDDESIDVSFNSSDEEHLTAFLAQNSDSDISDSEADEIDRMLISQQSMSAGQLSVLSDDSTKSSPGPEIHVDRTVRRSASFSSLPIEDTKPSDPLMDSVSGLSVMSQQSAPTVITDVSSKNKFTSRFKKSKAIKSEPNDLLRDSLDKKSIFNRKTKKAHSDPAILESEHQHQESALLYEDAAKISRAKKIEYMCEAYMNWFRQIFSENATRDERTAKYTILLITIGTFYITILRYCSLDLFLLLLCVNAYGFYYVVRERRQLAVMAAKRKLRRVMQQEKRKWYSWFNFYHNNATPATTTSQATPAENSLKNSKKNSVNTVSAES